MLTRLLRGLGNAFQNNIGRNNGWRYDKPKQYNENYG